MDPLHDQFLSTSKDPNSQLKKKQAKDYINSRPTADDLDMLETGHGVAYHQMCGKLSKRFQAKELKPGNKFGRLDHTADKSFSSSSQHKFGYIRFKKSPVFSGVEQSGAAYQQRHVCDKDTFIAGEKCCGFNGSKSIPKKNVIKIQKTNNMSIRTKNVADCCQTEHDGKSDDSTQRSGTVLLNYILNGISSGNTHGCDEDTLQFYVTIPSEETLRRALSDFLPSSDVKDAIKAVFKKFPNLMRGNPPFPHVLSIAIASALYIHFIRAVRVSAKLGGVEGSLQQRLQISSDYMIRSEPTPVLYKCLTAVGNDDQNGAEIPVEAFAEQYLNVQNTSDIPFCTRYSEAEADDTVHSLSSKSSAK